MIGCTDYPAFYKMMVRAAKKYNKAIMADAKASARAGGGAKIDAFDQLADHEPADAKESSRMDAGSKGDSYDAKDSGGSDYK